MWTVPSLLNPRLTDMLTFPFPEGFEMSPDMEVGGEFEAVGTFLDNGDGTLTLLKIDGSDIPQEMVVEEVAATEIPLDPGVMGRAQAAGFNMGQTY